MKLVYIYILLVVISSCQNKKTTPINTVNSNTGTTSYRFDSLAFTYKLQAIKEEEEGNIEGAIECYNKAIEINPYYDTAYFNRGVLKKHLGDIEGALKDYTRVIEMNPNDGDAYYNRALLKNDKEAIEDYSKAIEIEPNFVSAYYNRGYIYSELGYNDKALADYKKALKVSPKPLQADAADMLANMGRIYYDREEFTQALACYNQAIEVAPNDGDLYYGRGLTKKRLGDKNGACADWRKAQALGIYAANALLTICDE